MFFFQNPLIYWERGCAASLTDCYCSKLSRDKLPVQSIHCHTIASRQGPDRKVSVGEDCRSCRSLLAVPPASRGSAMPRICRSCRSLLAVPPASRGSFNS